MKARIRKKSSNFWIGEVYGTPSSFIFTILYIDPEPNWYQVTPNCFTKLGASLELKKWIRENVPKEFDI